MTPEQQIEAEVRALLKKFGRGVDVAAHLRIPSKDVHQLFGAEPRISKVLAGSLGYERQWVKTGVKNV